MSATLTMLLLGGAVVFVFGGLIGHELCERAFDDRSRRQADVQRRIAEQLRLLREAKVRSPMESATHRVRGRSELAPHVDDEEWLP